VRQSSSPPKLALLAACAAAVCSATLAALLPFTATIDIAFRGFFFVTVAGSGVAAVNDGGGALTQITFPPGAFAASTEFPGSFPIGGIAVDAANGTGHFAGLTPSGGGGTMPVLGLARICLLAGCASAAVALDLPLGVVGAGGVAQVSGPLGVTLSGAPWTKGAVTVSRTGAVSVVSGYAHGPASLSGSTARAGGALGLVTPIRITSTLPGFEDLDSWALLDVQLVPEPATLLLVGAGLAGLARAGRARRRRA